MAILSSNFRNNCSAGFGPDLFLRVKLEPYFTEDYGQDCYFSHLGYAIFGGLVLVIVIIVLLLHFWTFIIHPPKTKLIRSVLITHVFLLVSVVGSILTGFFAPGSYIVALNVWFTFLLVMGIHYYTLGYQAFIQTLRRVEFQKKNLREYLGGTCITFSIIGVLILSGIVGMIGLIGLTVTLYTEYPDNDLSPIFFRVFSVGVGAHICMFMISMWIITTRFTSMLQDARRTIEASLANQKRHMELKELTKRMTIARNILMACSPIGVGVWLIQGVFLPMFWFIVLFNCLNVTLATFGVWFSLMPRESRMKVYKRLNCCCGAVTVEQASRVVTNRLSMRNSKMATAGAAKDTGSNPMDVVPATPSSNGTGGAIAVVEDS